MKIDNLIDKLKQDGYEVEYGKFNYWENIPYITREDYSRLFLTNMHYQHNSTTVGYDDKLITYDLVKEALEENAEYLLYINEDYVPLAKYGDKKIFKSWER